MKTHATLFKTPLLLLVLTALLSGLIACKPQEQDLFFKTISEGTGFPTGRSYGGKDPTFLIITKPEEVDAPGLDVQFPPELAQQLHNLDYPHNFVIILFRGETGAKSPKFTVDVLRLSRSDAEVVLRVKLGSPSPGDIVYDAFSSPYHAIVVAKENEWKAQMQFSLMIDDKPVASTSHFVP